MSEFTAVGSAAFFIVFWTMASVLAVGCWNIVKFVVTRSNRSPMAELAVRRIDTNPVASRSPVDAA